MPAEKDYVTTSGARVRKGQRGFLPSNEPALPNRITVRLSDYDLRILHAAAEANGTNPADLVRKLIRALNRLL